jgi:hypothetical protein
MPRRPAATPIAAIAECIIPQLLAPIATLLAAHLALLADLPDYIPVTVPAPAESTPAAIPAPAPSKPTAHTARMCARSSTRALVGTAPPTASSSFPPLLKRKKKEVFVVTPHNREILMAFEAFEPALSCLMQVFLSFFFSLTFKADTFPKDALIYSMMPTSSCAATVSVAIAYGSVFLNWCAYSLL